MNPAYSLDDMAEIIGETKYTLSAKIAGCKSKKQNTPAVIFYRGGIDKKTGKGRQPHYDKTEFLVWWNGVRAQEIERAIKLLEGHGYLVTKVGAGRTAPNAK